MCFVFSHPPAREMGIYVNGVYTSNSDLCSGFPGAGNPMNKYTLARLALAKSQIDERMALADDNEKLGELSLDPTVYLTRPAYAAFRDHCADIVHQLPQVGGNKSSLELTIRRRILTADEIAALPWRKRATASEQKRVATMYQVVVFIHTRDSKPISARAFNKSGDFKQKLASESKSTKQASVTVKACGSYLDIAVQACIALNDRSGVSLQQMKAYFRSNKKDFKNRMLLNALRTGVVNGMLAMHHQKKGSYKLGVISSGRAKAPWEK